MGWFDRWTGLDDDRARSDRAPLWKRAAWHAAKHLMRKHPGAVIAAAGSGAGYAVKQGAKDGAEVVKKSVGKLEAKAEDAKAAPTRSRQPDRISQAEMNKSPLASEGELVGHDDEPDEAAAVAHEASQRVVGLPFEASTGRSQRSLPPLSRDWPLFR
jgi:hypothetical protein